MLVLQSSKKFCPNAHIIRREDYAILEQVENIINDAKEKRKKLLAQADTQIDLMKKTVQEEARNFIEKTREDTERQCQQKQLEMLFSSIDKGVKFFSGLEQVFVQTLKSLFIKIWDEVPPEERIYKLVKNAVKTLPNCKLLYISVHPEQVSLLTTKIKELSVLQSSLERIEITGSKNCELDQCVLETETGILDASLNIQLDTLIKTIENTLH